METQRHKFRGYKFSQTSSIFALYFRAVFSNFRRDIAIHRVKCDFAGINFHERAKNSQNRESFFPRNFQPLK